MVTATRLRRYLEQESKEQTSEQQGVGILRDLREVKRRLAALQARGGLFSSIGLGEAVQDLMERVELESVAVAVE